MNASDEAKKKLIAGYEKYELTLRRQSNMYGVALDQQERKRQESLLADEN